ncbi:MAG: hypothetical protein VKO21_02435 [Candidatus Sericytochromatia bacterium]|nr:hypothetical protein [Candidatus Sericytochromatia bacterium]
MGRVQILTLGLGIVAGLAIVQPEARAQIRRGGGSVPAPVKTPTPLKVSAPPAAPAASPGVPAQLAEARGRTGLSVDFALGLGGLHGQAGVATTRTVTTQSAVTTADNSENRVTATPSQTTTSLVGGLGASYGLGLRWKSADGWATQLRLDGSVLGAGTSFTALSLFGQDKGKYTNTTRTVNTVTTVNTTTDRMDVSSLVPGFGGAGASVAIGLPAPFGEGQSSGVFTTTFSGLGNLPGGNSFILREGDSEAGGIKSAFSSQGGMVYRHGRSVQVHDLTAATSLAVLRQGSAELSLLGGLSLPVSIQQASFVQQTVSDKEGKHGAMRQT